MQIDPSLLPVQRFDIDWQLARAKPLDFDLYHHLPLNEKYICIRRKGQLLEPEKLKNLGSLNFFVRKEEYRSFIKLVGEQLGEMLTIKNQDSKKAAALAASSLLKSTFNQEDPQLMQMMVGNLYNITSTIIESVLETSNLGTKRAFRVLSEMVEKGSSAQKHPVNVAALAVLICYGIGYTSEKTLYSISVAALLHDIGMSKLDPAVAHAAMDPRVMTSEQKTQYQKHPELGIEILQERKIKVPNLSALMIMEHHEEMDGRGYPKGKTGKDINEMTHILKIADEIDELILGQDDPTQSLKYRLNHYFIEALDHKRFPPVLLARVRTVIL